MKDDAKFFFFFCGFIGFLLFYLISSLLYHDFVLGSLHGALGCVFFSISGRFLLGFALSASVQQSDNATNVGKPSQQIDQADSGRKKMPISKEELAAATNIEAIRNAKNVLPNNS